MKYLFYKVFKITVYLSYQYVHRSCRLKPFDIWRFKPVVLLSFAKEYGSRTQACAHTGTRGTQGKLRWKNSNDQWWRMDRIKSGKAVTDCNKPYSFWNREISGFHIHVYHLFMRAWAAAHLRMHSGVTKQKAGPTWKMASECERDHFPYFPGINL